MSTIGIGAGSGTENRGGVSAEARAEAQADQAPDRDGMIWHVAMTQPAREHFAMHHLLRNGFTVWLPHCTVTVRHARRVEQRLEPFFPSYVFVARRAPSHPQGEQAFSPITTTLGIASVIRTDGGRPAVITRRWLDQVAAELARHEATVRAQRAGKPACPFAAGDRLTVTEGPFGGVRAVCLMPARERVAVLLEVLGKEVKAVLPTHMLRAAE